VTKKIKYKVATELTEWEKNQKIKNETLRDVKSRFYKISGVTPGGDCVLTPQFKYADPEMTAEAIVKTYEAQCGLNYKPHIVLRRNLQAMIVEAIKGAVDAATGKSEAYRKVREKSAAARKRANKKENNKISPTVV
jgi:hypothetical protein